jgi:hypothetical protein
MKKTDITDIRRLAGLKQLNENYIYAAEEEEESTEETEEAIEEIDGDEEGMAAESEVQESSEEDEEDDEEEEDLEEAKSKKAKKDYDGDGKIESEKDEVWGSRMAAAKKAGNKVDEDIAWIMDKVNKLSK